MKSQETGSPTGQSMDDSPQNSSIRVSIQHRAKEEAEGAKRFLTPSSREKDDGNKRRASLIKHSGSSPSYRMQLPEIKSQTVVPGENGGKIFKHASLTHRIGLNAKDGQPAPIIEEVTKENFFTRDRGGVRGARGSRSSTHRSPVNGPITLDQKSKS